MLNYGDVKHEAVFRNFEKISMIPRGSGNEKEISDFLLKFGRDLGYEACQDEVLNVIIKKPASADYEHLDPVILQGHMDMVCEKNKGTEHDFLKDPLKLKIEGNILSAEGTTLGGDDGIAVAYCMSILEDKTLKHPPLEIFITTEEETGLVGAMKVDGSRFEGKRLINIDGEEEGIFLVSCAGGVRTKITLPLEKKKEMAEETIFELSVAGLRGGHSGADIHKGRGNANKLMGRILYEIKSTLGFNLYSIEGGAKMNAIPRECTAIIGVDPERVEALKRLLDSIMQTIYSEYKKTDPDFRISLSEIDKLPKDRKLPWRKSERNKAIHLLMATPNGVNTMSQDIEGLVESSNNLGVITYKGDKVLFENSTRSSVASKKEELSKKLEELAEFCDCEIKHTSDYPGWEYKEVSPLRDHMARVYEDKFGKAPQIEAIHAGLECGLFLDVISPDLDMVSMGPNMYDVHTPDERIEIDSADRLYGFLVEVLEKMKEM
ncbi:MAG TPA: aminoacyl-histidine dipeptidase [Thermotogota bacterium]|nr:aminoacyl-histidine dipeptidase [Thermotogota bacterium]HPJ89673.1 aminoacyl-histidine dipeptidase [Thermotogota bacterium]HPR95782.1 aminoacyl-histidine dipeptidase [Thermotogota bacterium]